MNGAAHDPLVRQLRQQIADLDETLVDVVNRRLELVARLKRYKEENGFAFEDPEREEWLLGYLLRANRGPLSDDAVRDLHAHVLALCKRDVGSGMHVGR